MEAQTLTNYALVGSVVLIALAIIIAVNAQVTQNLVATLAPNYQITNETVTFTANNTFYAVQTPGIAPPIGVVQVSNFTGATTFIVNSSCYSLDPGGISLRLFYQSSPSCTSLSLNSNAYNVTYTGDNATTSALAARNSTAAFSNYNLPALGTVFGAAIILLIIFSILFMFSKGGTKE